jgi:hypothetical protein
VSQHLLILHALLICILSEFPDAKFVQIIQVTYEIPCFYQRERTANCPIELLVPIERRHGCLFFLELLEVEATDHKFDCVIVLDSLTISGRAITHFRKSIK